jgi:hypothetical protein
MDTMATTSTTGPDADNCRTMPVLSELYECLTDAAKQCSFAQSFGKGFFCMHPNCEDFASPDNQ